MKQLLDARRKEERQKELARLKAIEDAKRLNRVVEKPYSVPRRRVAGAGADAVRKTCVIEAAAAKEAAEMRKKIGEGGDDDEDGCAAALTKGVARMDRTQR